jgi:hypothetical protein
MEVIAVTAERTSDNCERVLGLKLVKFSFPDGQEYLLGLKGLPLLSQYLCDCFVDRLGHMASMVKHELSRVHDRPEHIFQGLLFVRVGGHNID